LGDISPLGSVDERDWNDRINGHHFATPFASNNACILQTLGISFSTEKSLTFLKDLFKVFSKRSKHKKQRHL
jgi:hypothetical protein